MSHDHNLPTAGEPVATPGGLGDESMAGAHVADDIAAQLIKVEAEVAELKDAFLRAKAETDNVRKHPWPMSPRRTNMRSERFAEDLLPVKDALEQTLAVDKVTLDTLKSGAELTLKALKASFDRAQVVELDPQGREVRPAPSPGDADGGFGAGAEHGCGRLPEGLPHQRSRAAAGAGDRGQDQGGTTAEMPRRRRFSA